MTNLLALFVERSDELLQGLAEHLWLSGIATVVAVAIGVPCGVLAQRTRMGRSVLLGAASVLQTVPSLAMLTFLLPFFGIGATPAIIALTLYALLPILRNTYTGLAETPAGMVEMATALGMTRSQRLRMVEFRFAAPFIIAGIRTAAVISVGIATLSAFIGAGGLGTFINRGLALNNTDLVLLGAIPAALLALYVDWLLGTVEEFFKLEVKRKSVVFRFGVILCVGIVAVVALYATGESHRSESKLPGRIEVTVGSKNFTEQLILGEVVAQLLEGYDGIRVKRQFNLAGTAVCHQALTRGEIDVYPEYTGTALMSVLSMDAQMEPDTAWSVAKVQYEQRFGVTWLRPLGFANTYALAMRRRYAQENGWNTISDLSTAAQAQNAGFTAEFLERDDGYPGLSKHYGFSFGSARDMDPGLMYEAVRDGRVDIISAFSTDGRIAAYDLLVLDDDRRFFPPYDAALVIRMDILRDHPELRDILEELSGRLSPTRMQELNSAVDGEKKTPREVARSFLVSEGLTNR